MQTETEDRRWKGREGKVRLVAADGRLRSRQGLKALLGSWPEMQVVGEAADGEEAVRLVEDCLPDVVLMDVRMPGVDGLEATRLIKERSAGVRVVVLTMHVEYRDEACVAGADAFLVKGCSAEELLGVIVGG